MIPQKSFIYEMDHRWTCSSKVETGRKWENQQILALDKKWLNQPWLQILPCKTPEKKNT
jgi:hypothetical protein